MTVKISDILHQAADFHLAADYREYDSNPYKTRFSCSAMEEAVTWFYNESDASREVIELIEKGLQNMGLDTDSTRAFEQFGYTEEFGMSQELQQVRYAWLKFAALIAEEQGI